MLTKYCVDYVLDYCYIYHPPAADGWRRLRTISQVQTAACASTRRVRMQQ